MNLAAIEKDSRDYERFIGKVTIAENGCWEISGSKSKSGYSHFTISTKKKRAHRVSYQWQIGKIPDRLVLDHLCRNRGCVNPEHLEAVTDAENIRRGSGSKIAATFKNFSEEKRAEWRDATTKAAKLRAKKTTHCKNGHEYTLENTYRNPNNVFSRRCKICMQNWPSKLARMKNLEV